MVDEGDPSIPRPQDLTDSRSASLANLLSRVLAGVEIHPGSLDSGEVRVTAEYLAPAVQGALSDFGGAPFILRGDGSSGQSVPASILEQDFFPDLAVSFGSQHVWAAEVKFLRASNRNDAIAKAIGQGSLYRTRYRYVTVLLIDWSPSNGLDTSSAVKAAGGIGINLLVRPLVAGRVLNASSAGH